MTVKSAVRVAVAALTLPYVASIFASGVVVTATRTARTADETLVPISVIDRQQIENSNAFNLSDLLQLTPGVNTSVNGGLGKPSSLFIRGTNSSHVLTLVDGVKWSSATLGTTSFQYLPLDQIERVEVVRGPRASLYGSDALGGVIQIFTRRGSERQRSHISAGYGSHNTAELTAGLSGKKDELAYSAQFSGQRTDGIDAQQDDHPDDDGYRNYAFSGSLDKVFADASSLRLSLLRAGGTNEYDNAFTTPDKNNEVDFTQQVASLNYQKPMSDRWNSSLRLGQSIDDSENFENGADDGAFETKRWELSWQNDIALNENSLLTAGIDYADDRVGGSVNYLESSRDNLAGFAQWQRSQGRQSLVLGVRVDDNEQFGSQTTGQIDWGMDLPDDQKITLSFGTAFKAPSFNDLYFPGFGNPDLDPEESRSLEAGYRRRINDTLVSVNLFHTDIDKLIVFDLATFVPENINEASIKGAELVVQSEVAGWNLNANLSLLDPKDRQSGNQLRRRAKRSAAVVLQRSQGQWFYGGELKYTGKSFEDQDNTVVLDAYTLVNLKAGYQHTKHWRFSADLNNAFDEDYETAAGFNSLGRTIFLSAKFER